MERRLINIRSSLRSDNKWQNWLKNNEAVTITLSNLKIVSSDYQQHAGTGYFKTTFEGDKIPADIKTATINNPNSNPVYGGAYAQFYESFDKIKPMAANLTVDTSSLPLHIKEMRLL